ncbi:hypothetical protein GCM10010301_07670 [Streptomyces plicatus]|nr:hypothetical protein GCM10010301_07670 [Streptomyces plicatus]
MLDPLRLPSVNSLAGQREGTVGGRVAYRWREVSQLTGSNKTPKSGIQAKCESIGRRVGGLHGGRVRGLYGGGARVFAEGVPGRGSRRAGSGIGRCPVSCSSVRRAGMRSGRRGGPGG